jgi:hypothetical protein
MSDSSQDTSARGSPTSPPAISLPKGGGAIRDMGEKFTAMITIHASAILQTHSTSSAG